MNAGFVRRALSAAVDLVAVLLLIYVTFLIAGRQVLRDQVEDFDRIYEAYQEITEAYNADTELARLEYTAALELSGDNKTLQTLALENYQARLAVLDEQNVVDIEPFNRPLSGYFLNIIYYFAIGFVMLYGIYTVVMNGKTLGRRLLQVELEGKVNPVTIFLHDVVLKYFIPILILVVNLYTGALLLLFSALLDLIMISFSRKRATLRDFVLKMRLIRRNTKSIY
jgi:hypothetical protein